MELEINNSNYACTIVRIHNLLEADNSDNLEIFPIHGMNCILRKGSYKVGDYGVLFPTECQLSHDFCHNNNLYRHSELNQDTSEKGYIEDNRRVRAIKLRGNNSNALFLPISSLSYLGIDINDFKEGDSFEKINGSEVCRKYVVKVREAGPKNKTRGQTKKFERIDNKTFPEHWDTDSFFKNAGNYRDDDDVVVTQKLHGTSARFTNQQVKRRLGLLETFLNWSGIGSVELFEWDTLAGSRRVIKDIKARDTFEHYYDVDLWNTWLEKIEHLIPKNWVLYGEIVGFENENKQIQKNYTYDCVTGENKLYIYRITIVNSDGIVCDLGWDQIKEFCNNNGLNHVPELWKGKFSDFDVDNWLDTDYYSNGYSSAVMLSSNSPCDEGVCVRREGLTPYVTKAKSPKFLEHETKQLDSGEVDTETQESDDTTGE